MKKYLQKLLFLFIILFSIKAGISQNLEFLKTFKGKGYDISCDMIISNKSSIYIAGIFDSDTFSIGNCVLYNSTFLKNNRFLAKFDTFGNCIWMNKFSDDTLNYNIFRIAVDTSDNIYVTGAFHNQFDLDPTSNSYFVYGIPNYTNLFVAKYDFSGMLKWGFSIKDSLANTNSTVRDAIIKVDKEQNILLTGAYYKSINLNPTSSNYLFKGYGVFLAKYDYMGNYVFAFPLKASILDIESDEGNNILITGSTSNVVDFNPDSLVNYYLSADGIHGDYFLAKYTTSGTFIWAFCINGTGGTRSESGYAVKIDKRNNIYVAGEFSSLNMDFDPSPLNTEIISSKGESDIFFAKYDSMGNMLFTKSIGGNNIEYFKDLDRDKNGDFYWALTYWSGGMDCDFSSSSLILNQMGGGDDLVMRTDSTGKVISHILVATPYTDNYIFNVNGFNGNIFTLNIYGGGNVDFDPSSNFSTPNTYGGSDVVFAKYHVSSIANIDFITNPYTNINIYPNPATENISIVGITNNSLIRLYNMMGEQLIESKIENNTVIKIDKLPKGLYLIKIDNSNYSFNKLLILE